MMTRVTLFAIVTGLLASMGCGGGGQNKVMADTPALPYQAPDIAEITGIEEEEEAEDAEEAPEAAPAPAPTPAAAPAPAPAPAADPKAPATKTPAKTTAPKTAPKQ